jgi:hypothetical protein
MTYSPCVLACSGMRAGQEPAAEVPGSSPDVATANLKRQARRGQQRDSRTQMNSTIPGRPRRSKLQVQSLNDKLCALVALSIVNDHTGLLVLMIAFLYISSVRFISSRDWRTCSKYDLKSTVQLHHALQVINASAM